MTHSDLSSRLKRLIPVFAAAHVQWTDVRLCGVLKPLREVPDALPSGTLSQWLARQLEAAVDAGHPALLALVDKAESLQQQTVRQELDELLRAVKWGAEGHAGRNARVVRAWVLRASTDPVTLIELGNKHGLTRERIRQVIERMTAELVEQGAWTPAADLAQSLLDEQAPVGVAEITPKSKLSEVMGAGLGVASLLRWRDALGKSTGGILIDPIGPSFPTLIAATSSQRAEIKDRLSTFRNLVRRRGVVSLDDLAAKVACAPDQLLAGFSIEPSIESFDLEGRTWLWTGSGEGSRLAEEIRGLLAVLPATASVGLAELVGYLQRDERFSTLVGDDALPAAVFRKIVSSLADVDVQGERVRLTGDLAAARGQYLTERERALYEVMATAGGLMSRGAIAQAFQSEQGASIESISQLLLYWRGIVRLQRGVFKLAGWPQDPESLAQAAAESGQRMSAAGAARVDQSADEIAFDYEVRPSVFTVKRMQIPAPFQEWFATCGHRRFRSDQLPELVMGTGTEASGVVRLRRIDEVFRHLQVRTGDQVRVRVRKNGSVSVECKAA